MSVLFKSVFSVWYPQAAVSQVLRKRFFRLGRNERGDVAIAFGLLSVIMMMFIGAAIDLSKWLSARTDTLNAVDAAVLAGARSLQTNSTDPAAAVAAATSFYEANTRGRLQVLDSIKFVTARNDTSVKAEGTAEILTPFLGFAGVDKLPLIKLSEAEFAEAVVAVGGNSESSIELSLMLDITGSMAGSKIVDLKAAAKDLIDIVVWEDQSKATSRVALVPFSESVRIDNSLKTALGITGNSSYLFRNRSGYNVTYLRDFNCVTERTGVDALLDSTPVSTSNPGKFYDSNGSCLPGATIVPLTSDKNHLKSQIDSYQANGVTAGHLGTAWAWYMLSPNWTSKLPTASHPEPYSKLAETGPKGQPKLRKIAILMTDGEYNTQYCSTGVSYAAQNCTLTNGTSAQQALTLCTNMKAKGIDVYTVGFDVGDNSSVLNLLRNCASSPGKFYQADNGEQLKQAFRDIALKVSDLFLSK
ncbi:MAG: VWA domain-containing protein [Hyphomicrobiaceae bacterium]|nr:VWA domain-containing protein [Hyphomicrobiaceae bacterium]